MFLKTRKNVWFKSLSFVFVLGFVVFQFLLVFNSTISYAANDTPHKTTVQESSSERIVLEFNVNDFSKEPVIIDNESYFKLSCGDARVTNEKGYPELPQLGSNIIIPNDAHMELNILDTEYTDYPLTPIVPSKGIITRDVNPETIPYTFDAYDSSDWYPQDIASLSEPFIVRDVRGTTVHINAFSYQPSTQTLRVYHKVTVEIVPSDLSSVNVLNKQKSQIIPQFENIYDYMFLNYEVQDTKQSKASSEKMLVITHDAYRNAMVPFVTWKNQKGIDTHMVNMSQVSPQNSPTEIKNYIKNYYNQNNNLVYVLLVGDYAHISSPDYSTGVSDPAYTQISGNDYYPDIFVGRFSAESVADVETQVKRTLDFEKNGYNQLSWFRKGIGIASNQGPGHNGEYDDEHMDFIRNKLLGAGYTEIDRIYDPYATSTAVSKSLNAGRGIINYCGHGSSTSFVTSGFNSNNIKKLENANMLPFIISVACVNGQFYDRTCFAETWLRSTDNSGNPIGAVGTYMSTINQPWIPPMMGQDSINDLIAGNTVDSFGSLCYLGASKMLDNGGYSDILTFNTWTVFGDPSLQLLP